MERTAAAKRKAPLSSLQRRVRARRDEPEDIPSEPSDQSQGGESSGDEDSEEQSDDDEEDAESDSSSEEEEDEVEDPSTAASQISFGALAKAQASLPKIRRGKGRKGQKEEDSDSEEEDTSKRHKDPRSESKSKPSLPHRTNKHAPTEQSSKRQVTRRREVVSSNKPVARDPRFSAAVQGRPIDEERLRRAYGFLDEYRDSEMAQLREAAKKTKDAAAKEELKRALASMEGKKKAQQAREAERKLLEEHRRREKELVKQGKKPFYLKRSEQKKKLLVDRFASLKGKQVDRVIERRRKKLASKERRDMPMARREARS
ncbi:hypothetical protein Daesc_006476 [Daldinia eschscholtzii]|uniref:rRNA biogenesis protein RRP36 n=1 Tax=Daldinia eschscholtzii TaxID=292717 RepID=A0AAX6MIF6_9PEZI